MSEPDPTAFGARLRWLREDAGLSVRELGDRSGISVSYLRVLEVGRNSKTGKPSRASAQHLERLVQVLGEDQQLLELAGREPAGADAVSAVPRSGPASDAASYLGDLRTAARDLSRRTPFMRQRALDRLKDFSIDFRIVASGTLTCEPEDEPYLTRVAVQSCTSHLRAVSYQDLEWWGSTLGERYREAHESLLLQHPDVEITRIFLVTPDEYAILRPTFEWHQGLNIRTFVLDVDSDWISPRYREDYVVYDESLVRVAGPVSGDRKRAEFTDDLNKVREKLNDFEVLRQRAELFGGSEAWDKFLKESEGRGTS